LNKASDWGWANAISSLSAYNDPIAVEWRVESPKMTR
jgi:hypothetical protein